MKYINIEGVGIIMFPDTINHDDMFKLIIQDDDRSKLIGAGKISGDGKVLVPYELYCYGESVTLGCRCDKRRDNEALRKNLVMF